MAHSARTLTYSALILLTVGTASAVANWQRTITLRLGESYTVFDRREGQVTVQCGAPAVPGYPGGGHHGPGYPGGGHQGPGYPGGGPQGPGYPGAPSCGTVEVDRRLQNLALRRDFLSRGDCAYRRADGFERCEGRLDRFEVGAQKERFNRDLLDLKLQVESSCRNRGCAQIEVSRLLREYDALLNSVQYARIIFDGYQGVSFIDFPQNYRVNCSGW